MEVSCREVHRRGRAGKAVDRRLLLKCVLMDSLGGGASVWQVRMKRFLEMRGADSGRWKMICALPALWVGLLYDSEAQAAAYSLISDFTDEEHEYLRNQASCPPPRLDGPLTRQLPLLPVLQQLDVGLGVGFS